MLQLTKRSLKASTVLLSSIVALVYSPTSFAHHYIEIEALGCGGMVADWVINWGGHNPFNSADVERRAHTTDPWVVVAADQQITMCYGPTDRRRWYRVVWYNPASPSTDVWSPFEPCS